MIFEAEYMYSKNTFVIDRVILFHTLHGTCVVKILFHLDLEKLKKFFVMLMSYPMSRIVVILMFYPMS